MDVKKKLVELLRNAKAAMKAENLSCGLARNMFVADFMIANGVTVADGMDTDVPAGWIPVTERLPENYEAVMTCDEKGRIHIMAHHHNFQTPFGIVKGNFMGYSPVTHWMPLPEPPKGE